MEIYYSDRTLTMHDAIRMQSLLMWIILHSLLRSPKLNSDSSFGKKRQKTEFGGGKVIRGMEISE